MTYEALVLKHAMENLRAARLLLERCGGHDAELARLELDFAMRRFEQVLQIQFPPAAAVEAAVRAAREVA